ncbi:hypothetical protein J5N97_026842 [Dioscorea zingiberensis]|uniref:Uncharacterized protein n=1 Tax=Dioscorea zingiberensis TaxID=325984 RepID=A0A9D5H728_9LILI|nr:hypothetical protein J5N97_026842 [Dioscorea zingiberensis]
MASHAVPCPDPTNDIKEAFLRLPLPYVDEEFDAGKIWKDFMENQAEPAPYVHIKRKVYQSAVRRLVTVQIHAKIDLSAKIRRSKLSRSFSDLIPLPFSVLFIVTVIDDALCEQRLWDMKRRGDQNFYMCEIRKDFTIDATFKGNASRFLNHSCNPNCKLEKWQVDGETRVGVFASQSIKAGEPLTYDYRFVQFGPMVKCFCGASNCQGFLGSKRKTNEMTISWGCKRQRSSIKVTGNKLIHLNAVPPF